MAVLLPELLLADGPAWRAWLVEHHRTHSGVRLVLAKKGRPAPTSLSYDDALDEALCHGWIDGQLGRRDDDTYLQRFTPRRPRSRWSARNVGLVERLREEGRMQPAGEAEVARAVADGRWADAYAGSATAVVPDDLAAALRASAAAEAAWSGLTSQNRYAIVFRVGEARRPVTRAARIERFVAMLERGETPHPQRPPTPGPPHGCTPPG